MDLAGAIEDVRVGGGGAGGHLGSTLLKSRGGAVLHGGRTVVVGDPSNPHPVGSHEGYMYLNTRNPESQAYIARRGKETRNDRVESIHYGATNPWAVQAQGRWGLVREQRYRLLGIYAHMRTTMR